MLQQDDKKRDMTDCRPKIPSVSLSKVRFITCRNIRYPDKSAKDNSANDTSAKPTVRMPTVRKGQQCECQQCECDSRLRMSAVRMRQQCERRFSELCKLFFFFAKTFATFYLNFLPKNAHSSAVQHLPRDVKVGIHSQFLVRRDISHKENS